MGILSDENFGTRDGRKTSRAQMMAREAKRMNRESRAIQKPKLVSCTLAASKQEGVYFLSNMNVWLSAKFIKTDDRKTYALYYQQYLEGLKSLYHNINFILHAQSYGQTDKDGKVIDAAYMRNSNFDYNRKLRSYYGSRSTTRPVQRQSISENFIKVLNESITIINELEKVVNDKELQKHIPNFDATHEKNKKFQNNLTAIAQALIEQLQNNKIDLSTFESASEFNKDVSLKNLF